MAGGLATTTTIVRADFWRLGQCRPGDKFQYKRITWQSAVELRRRTERYIASIAAFASSGGSLVALDVVLPDDWEETIMHEIPADDARGSVAVKFRQVSARSDNANSRLVNVPFKSHTGQ
jgi:urea carboxylase